MDIWFYHLRRQKLEKALPVLVEKILERGWRAVVEARTPERIAALDDALWTFRDDSFLAHGTARDGDAAMQPVFLTTGPDNPNGARARLFVEGADPTPALAAGAYERLLILFDDNDEDEVTRARERFRECRDAGHAVSYWSQDDEGRWEKRG